LALLACVFGSLFVASCATRSASTPFVKKKEGFVDVGGYPDTLSGPKREEFERAKREALARRAGEKPAALPSIESRDPALRAALAALGAKPSADDHLRVARAYQQVGVQDIALDHYSDALRLAPKSVPALDGRARLWRDAGMIVPALADAHRARYYDPTSAEVRNTLGTILERRGLCAEALGQYREALRLRPDAAWAQQNVTRLADTCK